MNCKPGEMAMIIRGKNAGTVLTCLELLVDGCTMPHAGGAVHIANLEPLWRVDRKLPWRSNIGTRALWPLCPDRILMPIRPQRDEDLEETERIARERLGISEWVEDRELVPHG